MDRNTLERREHSIGSAVDGQPTSVAQHIPPNKIQGKHSLYIMRISKRSDRLCTMHWMYLYGVVLRGFTDANFVFSPTTKTAALTNVLPASPKTLLDSDTMFTMVAEAKGEPHSTEEWTPTKHELLIMVSLSFISLMVALDATVLVTVLPVSC